MSYERASLSKIGKSIETIERLLINFEIKKIRQINTNREILHRLTSVPIPPNIITINNDQNRWRGMTFSRNSLNHNDKPLFSAPLANAILPPIRNRTCHGNRWLTCFQFMSGSYFWPANKLFLGQEHAI